MGGKSKAPKGPDWNKLLALSEKYQAENSALMNEYLDLFEQQYGDQKALQDQLNEIYLPGMKDEAELSKIQRDRYREMGVPFENEYLDKLTNWDTAERRDERAGEAQAGIGAAADAARESELRRLESYGIDPSQTRSAALDSSLRLQEAVSKAGAGNAERKAVEREGMAMGAEAVNLYRGMPVLSSQALSNAIGAGQASMGNQQALNQYGNSGYGQGANMLGQGWNMAQGGYGTAGNLHQNDLMAHEMNQKYSPMNTLGNLAGAYLGMSAGGGSFNPTKWFAAEGGPINHYAEGGATSATGNQPSGVPMPGQGQPDTRAAMPRPVSQGIPPENVTAQLSPGEFVIPDDVARWEGEKNLQKIINKAREDRVKTEQQRDMNQRSLGIPA